MNVGGTKRAHVVWLVKDGGTGASSVAIANAATGETVLWNNALGASEWLRLSSDGQLAEVSADNGDTWDPRPDGLVGLIPQVLGGSNNAVTVTGVDGTIDYAYTAVG